MVNPKFIPLREVNSLLIAMYEGWNKKYLNYKDLWDAIKKEYTDTQIDGDKGFILQTAIMPKFNLKQALCYIVPNVNNRLKKDYEILKQLGISLKINEYTIENDITNNFIVISCMIPEWMHGLSKKKILKEYSNEK